MAERDAFAQLQRDLAAEQRHTNPEAMRRQAQPAKASDQQIEELVDAVEPRGRRRRC